MAGICFILNEQTRRLGRLLWASSASLFILSFLYYMEKSFHFGMLIEHALQFGAPLILYGALYERDFFDRYLVFVRACVALTFVGHGLYASGYYPIPGPFIDMVINILEVKEDVARTLLFVAGSLDFAVGILIFFPKTQFGALVFACIWGSSTAIARIMANIDFNFFFSSSHQWVMEAVYRVPHGLAPFALLLYLYAIEKHKEDNHQVLE